MATPGTSNASSSVPQVVTEVGPDDILFGRGAPIVQTSGNVRFRDIVNTNKVAYASTRCRQTKDSIARDIIRLIEGRGGKFLKEIKSPEEAQKHNVPEGVKAWLVAEYDEIVEKVKQTLRETEKNAAADKGSESPAAATSNNVLSSMVSSLPNISVTNPRNDIDASVITTSLFPLLQRNQQVIALQNILRHNQIQHHQTQQQQQQQGLADILRQYQLNQQQRLAASLPTAATGGGLASNVLSQAAAFPGLLSSSSVPGQLSIEDYLFALRRDQPHSLGVPPNAYGVPNSHSTLSSMANINYPSYSSRQQLEELLRQEATLAALRRHRQQLADHLQPQSSSMFEGLQSASAASLVNFTSIHGDDQIATVNSSDASPPNLSLPRTSDPLQHQQLTQPAVPIETIDDQIQESTAPESISHPTKESNEKKKQSADQIDDVVSTSASKTERHTKKRREK